MENLVTIQNSQVVVSSRQVAESFEKLHKNVLQNIEDILAAENSATRFFTQSTFENRGKQYPEYLMNRDGFTLLAMSFTGSKAMQWKLKYIEAFNEMEKQLAKTQLPDFTNPSISARAWADEYDAKRIAQAQVKVLQPKAAVYDSFVNKGHTVGFRDFAKSLSMKQKILREWLVNNKYIYMQEYTNAKKEIKHRARPYANVVDAGLITMKDIQNKGFTGVQMRFTMKGKLFLREELVCQGVLN